MTNNKGKREQVEGFEVSNTMWSGNESVRGNAPAVHSVDLDCVVHVLIKKNSDFSQKTRICIHSSGTT